MKKDEDQRRSFLKHLLAGTAAVIGTAAIIKPAKADSISSAKHPNETLYHESESFKKYYKNLS